MTAQLIPIPRTLTSGTPARTPEDRFVDACLDDPRLRRFTEPQVRSMFRQLEHARRSAASATPH